MTCMSQVFFSGHSKRLVCMIGMSQVFLEWSAGMYDLYVPSIFRVVTAHGRCQYMGLTYSN